jgi:hypothetical protein
MLSLRSYPGVPSQTIGVSSSSSAAAAHFHRSIPPTKRRRKPLLIQVQTEVKIRLDIRSAAELDGKKSRRGGQKIQTVIPPDGGGNVDAGRYSFHFPSRVAVGRSPTMVPTTPLLFSGSLEL